jgi:hypothetical protein
MRRRSGTGLARPPGSPPATVGVAHCSGLSAICRLPSVVCCLLSVVGRLSFCRLSSVVCPLLSVVCRLLSAVGPLLSAVCCLLSVVCCLLSVACHLSSVVCRLLPVICCLLSVVCCPRGNRHAIAMPATRAITRPTRRPAYDAPTGSGRDGNASNPDRNEGADGFGQPRLHYVQSRGQQSATSREPQPPPCSSTLCTLLCAPVSAVCRLLSVVGPARF